MRVCCFLFALAGLVGFLGTAFAGGQNRAPKAGFDKPDSSGNPSGSDASGRGSRYEDSSGLRRLRDAGVEDGEITLVERTNASVRVSFTLRPTTKSMIRCELALPDPTAWDGRLWGIGNGGWAGVLWYEQRGSSATLTCDLGTSRTTRNDLDEPREVLTDYAHRATHLATLAAKRLVKAYYGRLPDRSYFHGASCGGRQGIMEATLYPEDYDGIVSEVPGFVERSRIGHAWKRDRLTARYGKWFSNEEIAAVREAELAYFAKTDPEWARGKFIVDPYPTKEKLDGCWREIVCRCPALADREALWRELFDPVVVKGEVFTPGRLLGVEFGSVWGFILPKRLGKAKPSEVTEEELAAFTHDPEIVPSPNLSAFKARGGKIIMYGGFEDLSCAEPEMRAYYESVIRTMGGLASVRPFFAYYSEPGRSHGARGEANGSGHVGKALDLTSKIVAWCEKGVDPGVLKFEWVDGSRVLTVAAYPEKGLSSYALPLRNSDID